MGFYGTKQGWVQVQLYLSTFFVYELYLYLYLSTLLNYLKFQVLFKCFHCALVIKSRSGSRPKSEGGGAEGGAETISGQSWNRVRVSRVGSGSGSDSDFRIGFGSGSGSNFVRNFFKFSDLILFFERLYLQ